MNIVYYSHAGNTARFVNNKLKPVVDSMPVLLEGDAPRHRIEGCNVVELEAVGPHLGLKGHDPLVQPGRDIIVFPIYARGNNETGKLEDTVPRPIKEYIESTPKGKIAGAVVMGNRTFGRNYGAVNPEEFGDYEIPILGVVELSGTEAEAREIREKLRELATKGD